MKLSAKILFKNLVAVVFWLYVIVNTFIFSVDAYLVQRFPNVGTLFSFKYVFLLILVVITWYTLKTVRFSLLMGYIVGFPAVLFFWIIPSKFFKRGQYSFVLLYASAIFGFFRNLKKDTLDFAAFLLGTTFCLSSNRYLNIIGIVLIMLFMFRHIYSRIRVSINPMHILSVDVSELIKIMGNEFKFEKILISDSKSEEENRKSTVTSVVLYSSFLNYLDGNIKRFHESKTFVWMFGYGLVWTIILTMLCFALANQGLFNISPGNFKIEGPVRFFDFFYYSVLNVFAADADNISPSSTLSKSIRILQILTGVVITGVLATVIFSVQSDKYSENLEIISETARKNNEEIKEKTKKALSISLKELRDTLETQGDFFATVAKWLDDNSGNDKSLRDSEMD